MLDGIFIMTEGNQPTTYRAGNVFFQVAAGQPHTEKISQQPGFSLGGSIAGREYSPTG